MTALKLAGLAVGVWLGVMSSNAGAQTSPLTWSRNVRGSVSVRSLLCVPNERSSSFVIPAPTDFDAWEFGAQSGAVLCPEVGYSSMLVNAGQSSRITRSLVRAGTWARCTRSDVFHPRASARVASSSTFEYSFYVDTRTPFVLRGEGEAAGGGGFVRFTAPGGVLLERSPEEPGPFELTGELLPGVHTLVCRAMLEAEYPEGAVPRHEWGSISLRLEMPARACPCDWNVDGVVDSADVFAYIEVFLGGGGDFDFDGAADSRDFFEFLRCFFEVPALCE